MASNIKKISLKACGILTNIFFIIYLFISMFKKMVQIVGNQSPSRPGQYQSS